eukprot:gb/GECH01012604.1/.p1 GENE.gb/GECH01012604.1/~~gb/GECH01012604.1/.p1  ORF type:complete len:748 (+),score=160.27 gb/GECH01012604.1/:1-2244(+)
MEENSFGRLIIVSNRLPVSGKRDEDGNWKFTKSSGGLVTALSGIQDTDFIWVGWPGMEIEDQEEANALKTTLRENYDCEPVMLSQKLVDKYYNGFSNSILWPLFHYMPEDSHFDNNLYNAYVDVNKKFAEAIVDIYMPGDILWVHDYHLMLLPNFVRDKIPDANIGFFLHIPFPSSEIYRVLPRGPQLLDGVLNSDLIGFHTFEYQRHFLKTCTRLLGVENAPNGVRYQGRFVSVCTDPVGIDPDKFHNKLISSEVMNRVEELRQTFRGRKIILGVDRLDYIKGVPHKLRGLERFFQEHPDWIGKVVLIQVAVPSRIGVKEYQELKHEVEELVGRINGKYGSVSFNPIHYLFSSVDFAELVALYRIADTLLVSSIRDGMNLVSEEYVVCQKESHGALILSEFAGASGSLSGSIIVNPWDTKMVSDAIEKALTMGAGERKRRYKELSQFVETHTAKNWASVFFGELRKAVARSQQAGLSHLLSEDERFRSCYKESSKRLLVFEVDHLSSAQTSLPPLLSQPDRNLIHCLETLAADDKNILVLHSSRDKYALDRWFGDIPCILTAEDGFFMRHTIGSNTEWTSLLPEMDVISWRESIKPVLEYFQERTPGSFYEEKECQLLWQYGNADKDYGAMQANELFIHLDSYYQKMPIEVSIRNFAVQIKPLGVNIRPVVKHALSSNADADFVLVVASEYSHYNLTEGVDDSFHGSWFACTVGNKSEHASTFMRNSPSLELFLEKLHRETFDNSQ